MEPDAAASKIRWIGPNSGRVVARIEGPEPGAIYLVSKTEIVVGRASAHKPADIEIADNNYVSRGHLQLRRRSADCVWSVKCAGKNGIVVNDNTVHKDDQWTDIPKTCTFRFPSTELSLEFEAFSVPELSESVSDSGFVSPSQYASIASPIPMTSNATSPFQRSGNVEGPSNSFQDDSDEAYDNAEANQLEQSNTGAVDSAKPPYSYAQLIIQAIASAPDRQLTLSGIYGYIVKNYPWYRWSDKGWQNSIRHNLSLNRYFVKMPRGDQCKGSFWRLDPSNEDLLISQAYQKRKRTNKTRFAAGSAPTSPTRTPSIGPPADAGEPPAAAPPATTIHNSTPKPLPLKSPSTQVLSVTPAGQQQDKIKIIPASAVAASKAQQATLFNTPVSRPLPPPQPQQLPPPPIAAAPLPPVKVEPPPPPKQPTTCNSVNDVISSVVQATHAHTMAKKAATSATAVTPPATANGALPPAAQTDAQPAQRQFTFSPIEQPSNLELSINSQSAPCSPKSFANGKPLLIAKREPHASGDSGGSGGSSVVGGATGGGGGVPFRVAVSARDGRNRLQLCHSPPEYVPVTRTDISALQMLTQRSRISGQELLTRYRGGSKSLSTTPVRELLAASASSASQYSGTNGESLVRALMGRSPEPRVIRKRKSGERAQSQHTTPMTSPSGCAAGGSSSSANTAGAFRSPPGVMAGAVTAVATTGTNNHNSNAHTQHNGAAVTDPEQMDPISLAAYNQGVAAATATFLQMRNTQQQLGNGLNYPTSAPHELYQNANHIYSPAVSVGQTPQQIDLFRQLQLARTNDLSTIIAPKYPRLN